MFCLVLSCLVLSCLVVSCLIMYCLVLSCLVLSRIGFLGRSAKADGTTCDGRARGQGSRRRRWRHGQGRRRQGTDDKGNGDGATGAMTKRARDNGSLFRPQTCATGERIDDLNRLCGSVGDEGLIYYRYTRFKTWRPRIHGGLCDGCMRRLSLPTVRVSTAILVM